MESLSRSSIKVATTLMIFQMMGIFITTQQHLVPQLVMPPKFRQRKMQWFIAYRSSLSFLAQNHNYDAL